MISFAQRIISDPGLFCLLFILYLFFVLCFFVARLCANNVLSSSLDSFSSSSFLPPEVDQPRMRAQALADHDAANKDELSLMAYEVSFSQA
jgi:hypothetical protein